MTIGTEFVGNASNTAANSTNAPMWTQNLGYGAVNYNYRIGTYLVTNQEYTAFLNAKDPNGINPFGLWNSNMGATIRGGISFDSGEAAGSKYSVKTDFDLKPVNYVSFYDAAMFTNWVSNGATSESSVTTGAYTINSGGITQRQRTGNVATLTTSAPHTLSVGGQVSVSGVDSAFNGNFLVTAVTETTFTYTTASSGDVSPTASGGSMIGTNATRDSGATWWLPSENEWVKAAYYDAVTGNYSLYATQSNTAPTVATSDAAGNITNAGANVANYNNGVAWNSATGNVSTTGSAGIDSRSFYGTYDQSGNVREWNEAYVTNSSRGVRGGSWNEAEPLLRASFRPSSSPTDETDIIGFRVATVPEPSSALLVLMAGAAWLLKKRKKASL